MDQVFFIESNMTGYGPTALKLLSEQGYQTHFVTRNPDEYASLSPNPITFADQVSVVDTFDITKLLHFFADKRPAAVVAFDDYRLVQAAIVAESLGLPHANVNGLINVRFKDRARSLTQSIGRAVDFAVRPLTDPGPTSPLGYPCVVKPVDDSGSTGVRICHSDADYHDAFAHIRSRGINLRSYHIANVVLVEEFIDGPEFTAELIWDREYRRWRLLGYTKKLMAEPPYRVELGAMFPYSFGPELDRSVEATVYRWLDAVEHRYGAAHVEFKLVDGQAVLMEINPRLGGDQIRDLMLHTCGADSINLYLQLYLGLAQDFPARPARPLYATSYYLLPPRPGQIVRVTPPAQSLPGVIRSKLTESEFLAATITDNDDRLGYVITIADEFEQSLAHAQTFMQHVELEYAD